MNPATLDLLVINAEHELELTADAVSLLVTVQGTSLVTGSAALTKAKEVARLVEELVKIGIGASDITLDGVHAEQASGILGKASAAIYRLRVRCTNLELLPDVLGAVTSAKNAKLDDLVWRYPESTEQHADWLRLAIAEANLKAGAAAVALGTRVVGVHHFSEERLDAEEHRESRHKTFSQHLSRVRQPVQLGFELTQRRRAGVRVNVHYRIEGYAPTRASSLARGGGEPAV